MLSFRRLRDILTLAIPIIGGMLSQNVLNLVDTYMVGRLGDSALAAVGLASFANFMCAAPLTALSFGVQAMSARRIGEGHADAAGLPLNGGLVLALGVGIPLSLVLAASAPVFFGWLAPDAVVAEAGAPYLQVRILAMTFLGMNFAFRGFWNATHRAWFYMGTLVLMHSSNIFLNWVFIYGNLGAPALGVTGAGLASAASTVLGTVSYFALALRHARGEGFLRGIPSRETLAAMLRLSLPTAVQQVFFAGGMTAFMWIIGRLGTDALAASKVVLDLLLVAMLPSLGFGMAATTFVGEALGRGRPDEARQWGWDVAKTACATVGTLALSAAIAPEVVLGIFIENPATRALGAGPLRLVAFTIGIDAVGMVLMNCLLGAGDNQRVMRASILLQWVLYLPVVYTFVLTGGTDLFAVWVLQAVYRVSLALLFITMWRGSRWTSIRV